MPAAQNKTSIHGQQSGRMRHSFGGSAMNIARFDLLERLIYVNALFIVGTLGTLIAPAILDSWATLLARGIRYDYFVRTCGIS